MVIRIYLLKQIVTKCNKKLIKCRVKINKKNEMNKKYFEKMH